MSQSVKLGDGSYFDTTGIYDTAQSQTQAEFNEAANTALASKAALNHTHDDRYYTESEINTKLAYSSGVSTLNLTYVVKETYGAVKWYKYGRIVVVNLSDITIKKGYSSDNVSIIATGLPKPVAIVTASFISHTKTWVRLQLETNGYLKPWYMGTPSSNVTFSGTFAYIAQS